MSVRSRSFAAAVAAYGDGSLDRDRLLAVFVAIVCCRPAALWSWTMAVDASAVSASVC